MKVERSASPIKMSESSSQKQSQFTMVHQRQDTMKPFGDNPNATRRPSSPFYKNGDSSPNQTQSRPQLVIPAVNPNISQPIKTKESGNKCSSGSGSLPTLSTPTSVNSLAKLKGEKASKISSDQETMETQPKRTKRKLGLSPLFHALASLNFLILALYAFAVGIIGADGDHILCMIFFINIIWYSQLFSV